MTLTEQRPEIRFTSSAAQAARFMLIWDTDQVEVLTPEKESLGIVTQHDILRAVAEGKDLTKVLVTDLLSQR